MINSKHQYGNSPADDVRKKYSGHDFNTSTFDVFSSSEFGRKMARDYILNSNIESYLNFWTKYAEENIFLSESEKKKITDSIDVTRYMAGYVEPVNGNVVLVGDIFRMLEEGKEKRILPMEIESFYKHKEVFKLLENVSHASSQKA